MMINGEQWWRLCRMFKECPHPDENQRAQLSRELGLEARQIKFWFQNRRTQMKVYTDMIFLNYPFPCFPIVSWVCMME
jgi:hypothetical protein